ncbi:MAG TPA: ABC-F family ATP-binding cassette domain-containing protein [Bryobacteraceae bacterium]|nr:ABC-F family ATP-binding cassette domain-containing protein [Bryobacteraceae bacterium]
MIVLSAASKRFGDTVLFEDAGWQIDPGDRIGLVGANGSGKTTLLRILAGLESVDRGEVRRPRTLTIGYLPQSGLELEGRTVFEECLAVFSALRAIEAEMEQLAGRMASLDAASPAWREAAERFHRLEADYRSRDGYRMEARVGEVLAGLGFPKQDWMRRTEEFSGGWQMRIALAKLLLEQPDLLLLDEPTNHLDLEARNWLEDYLRSYPHAFVVVSHDRYFLDVTVERIVEIWNRKLHVYAGNYTQYLEQKQQRMAQLEATWRNRQAKAEQLHRFIERFRYKASKARQVQSRIRELERMEHIELPREEKTVHFRFPQPEPSGRVVAEARGLAKRYGERVVFEDARFVIERGDRVALVGPNGAGKSTLIRLLAGLEPVTSGEIRLGHNVEISYFAQDQYKELDPTVRLLDDLRSLDPHATETELRTLLGCFLFSGDAVFRPVGVLSGGERNRYALARILLRPSNFLLLDEPTNHLDLRAKEVLLEALEAFSGTLVFVSHDRYFLDRLATRVFEIGGGQIHVHPGNYEEYLWRKQQQAGMTAQVPVPSAAREPAPERTAPARPRRMNPMKRRRMEEQLETVENEIARLEAEIAETEQALASFTSGEETKRLLAQLARRRNELDALLRDWEEIARALES